MTVHTSDMKWRPSIEANISILHEPINDGPWIRHTLDFQWTACSMSLRDERTTEHMSIDHGAFWSTATLKQQQNWPWRRTRIVQMFYSRWMASKVRSVKFESKPWTWARIANRTLKKTDEDHHETWLDSTEFKHNLTARLYRCTAFKPHVLEVPINKWRCRSFKFRAFCRILQTSNTRRDTKALHSLRFRTYMLEDMLRDPVARSVRLVYIDRSVDWPDDVCSQSTEKMWRIVTSGTSTFKASGYELGLRWAIKGILSRVSHPLPTEHEIIEAINLIRRIVTPRRFTINGDQRIQHKTERAISSPANLHMRAAPFETKDDLR